MVETQDLGGAWQLRWSDGQRGRKHFSERDSADATVYLSGLVPGEVHLDLMAAGLLADTNEGLNVLSARWVEESIWTYRRTFAATPRMRQGRVWLVFERLELTASIVLNGEEIAKHSNAYLPCRVDITGKLREGENVLVVHLESGLFEVADKRVEGYQNSYDQLLHKRHWLRTVQSSFSWDWSPRLLNVGISGPVRLEWTGAPVRIDTLTPLATVSDDLSEGRVRARLFIESLADSALHGTIQLSVAETGNSSEAEVFIAPGQGALEAELTVAHPDLWWPVGHGDQPLYTLTASLSVDGAEIDSKKAMIGFRCVVVNQDPHPQGGRYFVIEVNGRKIFCKGGNLAPTDTIVARIDRERYDKLTDLALEANFNMLRVWGGGLYESEDFYDFCNRKGILVWQEFIYACGRFPMQDERFFANAKAEAVYQIRRLARHPSLVVWCGNNEMEWGAWGWGYDSSGVILPDYAFFHLTLPRLLAEEDPTRYYQPSSPYSPDLGEPNADLAGDQHPWSVGIMGHDFRDYRKMVCRFPNEGGMLGANSLPTVLKCLPPDQRHYNSLAWQVHENSIANMEEPGVQDGLFDLFLGLDPRGMDMPEFVYWSGLLQGEALSEYIGNFRRRKFDVSAAIFWSFNDVWPCIRSWTIADYYLRRTPSFCPVKRAFAPVSLVVADEGETVAVYGINDTAEPVAGSLRYGVFALAGDYPIDARASVTLAPNASTRLAAFPTADWLAVDEPRTWTAAFGMLEDADGDLLARGRLIVPPFKEMKWQKAEVNVAREGGRVVCDSDVFAWGVCVDLDGEEPLGDNFFDIYPGVPYVLPGEWDRLPVVIRTGNRP